MIATSPDRAEPGWRATTEHQVLRRRIEILRDVAKLDVRSRRREIAPAWAETDCADASEASSSPRRKR